MLVVHASAALRGPRDGPRRPARAADRALPDRTARLDRASAARRCHGSRVRAGGRHRTTRTSTSCSPRRRRRGSSRPTARGPARARREDRGRDPRPDRAHGRGPDFRWPALRLNQFNWHIALFAADAIVNGAGRRSLRAGAPPRRFLGGVPAPRDRRNLGPGLRFRYLPARPARIPRNFDSAEYANIVLGFSRTTGARARGMLVPARLGLLRAWVRRALGRLLDARRLPQLGHRARLRALAPGQEGAARAGGAARDRRDTRVAAGTRVGRVGKWMLDPGLQAYAERPTRRRGPAAVAFGLRSSPEPRERLPRGLALRSQRHAGPHGRAGAAPARPPALYAFDPETGRLAVTTPAYNTAIVAVNHGAFPYGGSTSRGSSTAAGGRRRASAACAPARSGSRVRTEAGCARCTGRAAPAARRCGSRAPPGGGGDARGAGRSATCGCGARPARAAARDERVPVHAGRDRGALDGRRAPAGDAVRVTFPTWGRATRVGAASRRAERGRVAAAGPLARRLAAPRAATG